MPALAIPRDLDLQKLLGGAQLPALPQSAVRLMEVARNPSNGPAEFAAPIEADPGLTGQVLRFINSSYFGFAREVSSVKAGIRLVGIRTIKSFALWNAVFSLIPNPKCGPFDLKSLWQDSLRRALFARTVAKLQGVADAEPVFTAALLQDIAVPLLAKASPGVYVKLLAARNGGRRRLSMVERSVFGWTHAEAGAVLARQWNLPEECAVLIESHIHLDDHIAPGGNAAGPAVALSALLPSTVDPLWVDCALLEAYYAKVMLAGSPLLAVLLNQIDGEFANFAPVMKVATPAKLLGERYREVTA